MKRLVSFLVAVLMAAGGLWAQCNPLQLPYIEDFSQDLYSLGLPSCWLHATPDSIGQWTDMPTVVPVAGYGDGMQLRIKASTSEFDYGVAMPPVDSTAGFVDLSFWAASFADSSSPQATLTVALMADGNSLAPGVEVAPATLPAEGRSRHYICRLAIPDSGLWRPRFEVTAGLGCYVDRVLLASGSACTGGPVQLPYFATFLQSHADRLPGCWSGWPVLGQGFGDMPAVVATEGYDDPWHLRIAASEAGACNGVAMPPVDSAVGFVELSFLAASWPGCDSMPVTLAVGLTADADTLGMNEVQGYASLPTDGRYRSYSFHMALPDSGMWRPTLEVVDGSGCFVARPMVFEGASCQQPQGLVLDWVDSSSAHIVWQQAADSCLWLVRVGSDVFIEQDSADLLLTGLETDANIHVEVRALCRAGDTTDAAVLDFRTRCGMQQMPLYEDFNACFDGDDPHCWIVAGRTNGNQSYTLVTAPEVDAEYVMSMADGGTPIGLISPVMAPTADRMHVMFRLMFSGPGTFEAGLMRHPDSAFVPVLTIENTSLDVAGHQPWFDYEFYTDTVASVGLDEPYYVAFFWNGDSPVHIDDIALLPSGPCHAPTAAHIDTIYADTVVLVWEDFSDTPAGYEVRYGALPAFADADNSLMTFNAELAIGGLDASTEYHFWLRALCPDDSARWLYVGSGSTECGPVGLPYEQRFSDSDLDTVRCWLSDAAVSESRLWHCMNGQLYMHVSGGDSMLVATPLMLAPANELRIVFGVGVMDGNMMEVGLADDTLGNFVPLYTVYAGEGHQTHGFYTDQLQLSDTMRIAFRLIAPFGGASQVFIDDLVVRRQRCHDPEGLWVDSLSADMAVLHIGDPAGTGFYRVCAEHDGTTDTLFLADSVATLTGLIPGTTYHVDVVAVCPDGSMSQPVGTTFRTRCPYIAHTDLPYEQNFDQMAVGSVNPDVPCWTIMHFNSRHYLRQAETDNSTAISIDVEHQWSRTYLSLPGVDVVNDLLLRFAAVNALGGIAMIEVGVMSEPDDDLTFFPVDTVYCPATGLWHNYEVLLSSYEGSEHWPALRVTSTMSTEVRIDDVWLGLVPPCSGAISNVTVSDVWSYSANIEWNVDLAYNQGAAYTIHVETEDGQPAGDFFVDTTAYNICNLDELTSYRVWVEMFCGGDVQAVSDYVSFTTRCDNAQTIEHSSFSHLVLPFMNSQLPCNAQKRFSATQQLFVADEFGNLPSTITGLDFRYCNEAVPFEVEECSIFLSPCYADTLSQWQTAGQQLVYSGPLLFEGNDWNTVYFSAPYEYDGVANLLVTVVANGKPVADGITFGGYNTGRQVSLFYSSNTVPFADTMEVIASYRRSDIHFHICPGEVPSCASPVLDEVVASSDYIRMVYDADGDMCQMSISQGWIWNGDVQTADNSGDFTFENLDPLTNYIVGVRRVCPGMTSNWATRVVRTTQIVCDLPTDLAAIEVGYDDAVVAFDANGADRWQLHLFNFRIDTVIDLTDTLCHLTGLVPDVTYHVAVRSLCGLNYSLRSEWSDTLDFATAYCMPVASASVAADGATSAVVRWNPPASDGVASYRVEYGLREFVRGEAIAAYNTTDTMLRIEGLEPGIMYDFYVAAVCDDGSRSVWVFAGGVPPVGIDVSAQQSELRMVLSPNPASGSVGVSTDGPADLTLYDLEGRTLMHTVTSGGMQTLDISHLSQGTYFVRATTPQGSTVGKLIVR